MITSLETPPRRRRLGSLWRPIASHVLFLVGGVLLLRMDPFGFSQLTKYYPQDLLAVAMAGCYPDAAGGECVKEGRSETAVVLLRDPDLAAFDEPWPPNYGFHARILKAIHAKKTEGSRHGHRLRGQARRSDHCGPWRPSSTAAAPRGFRSTPRRSVWTASAYTVS